MSKKTKKSKANYFEDGGGFTWNKDISFGKNMINAYKSGALDLAIGVASTLAGSALSGGLSSGVGNIALGLGNAANLIPGVGTTLNAAFNIAGGLTNRLIGSQINNKAVLDIKSANGALSNMAFSASNNEDLLALSNFGLLDKVKISDVGKDGLLSNKAKNLTRLLNQQRELANLLALANYNLAVGNLDTLNDLNVLANYAANGGPLYTHGGTWDNGLTYINEGKTHELNPMEGVQLGIDNEGVPNLVEEGEVVWNDYVFSNRMKVPKKTRDNLKLGNSEITFADAAKRLGKESEERPNDPISKNGLDNLMGRLAVSQELLRVSKIGNKYAKGGKLGKLFAGTGPLSQSLSTETPRNSSSSQKSGDTTNTNYLTNLRYAPVLGAAIGLGLNLFSSPDYSDYNTLMQEAQNAGSYTPILPTLINDYLTYNPIDRAWATNKLNAQSSAGRRAIVNLSAGNRATALAGLVANNYNTQLRLGDLLVLADMYNNELRERVANFNRATNQTNAELGLKAAMANQEAALKYRGLRLEGINKAIAMRNAIDSARATSMSANLTNLFDSLGNIGREEFAKQMVRGNKSLLYDWFGRYKNLILDDLKTT